MLIEMRPPLLLFLAVVPTMLKSPTALPSSRWATACASPRPEKTLGGAKVKAQTKLKAKKETRNIQRW
jgi:hypothetical protein